MDHLGNRLKNLRIAAGLSQKNVAEFLQKKLSFVTEYESEALLISSDVLDSLAALFCCPVQTILSDEDPTSATGFIYPTFALAKEDIKALASINKIVLNQMEMDTLMQG